MDILKGSGCTFSTSGRQWVPFTGNPMLARQQAKRHRLVRKGIAGCGTMSKAQLRAAATVAYQEHLIRRIVRP